MIELRKVFMRDGKNYISVCEDSNEVGRIHSKRGRAELVMKSKPITSDGFEELERLKRRLGAFESLFESL